LISSAARKVGRYWSASASNRRRPARADRARGSPLSAHSPIAGGTGVRWIGAQRDVLGGDLQGHGDLEALSTASHLYGLGPLEGLRGEVSIFDSVPSIARIEKDCVVTTTSWSARACFLVLEVTRGATTAHVKIDVGCGTVITSSITNEAVDAAALKVGDAAYAVIKASDVMVGKD
jgi:molybdopterin-binding protein